MNYAEWETIKIDPLKIKLDESNPRVILDDYSQESIRVFLIEYFDVLELATSIVQSNGIPPTERILCIKENNNIVVVEGNRRVTACQILKNPKLIPEHLRKRLPTNSEISSFLEKIEVVVAPNRDDTENYITMRHTGSGTKRWSRLAENRRYIIRHIDQKQSINHISSILNVSTYQVRKGIQFYFFIEYIKNNLDWNEKELEIINNPLLETTKIDRFLPFSTKAKEIMTINFDANHNVIHKIDKDNFDKALKTIVKKIFITNELNTRSTFDEVFNEEIIKLCTKRKDNNSSKPTSTNKEINKEKGKKNNDKTFIRESHGKNDIENNKPKEKEHRNNNNTNNKGKDVKSNKDQKTEFKRQPQPSNRKYPFEGVNYKGGIIGISQTLYELHRINIEKFPFSSTVLIRTLLECTIQEYITHKNIDIKVKGNKKIKELSIAALLGTCSNPSNGNFKNLQKENALLARIINEAKNLNDHDELNLVTHGNYREPSSQAIWNIERRWYAAIDIMIREITGHNS